MMKRRILADRWVIVTKRRYLSGRNEYRRMYLARYEKAGEPMTTTEIMDAAHYVAEPVLPHPLTPENWRIMRITISEDMPE